MITPSQLESRRDQILEEMREKGFEVDKDSYGEFVTLKLIRAERLSSNAYGRGFPGGPPAAPVFGVPHDAARDEK